MIPTIPPELWLRTAWFIPSSIRRDLYPVNPVFLDLALNDRYSDINLAIRWTTATTKQLKHLNQPHIAHRVQRLTLSSDWLESNMHLDPSEEVTLRTTVAWYLPFDLGRFIDPIVCRISDTKRCNALMETTLVNFPNISSLIIVQETGLSSQIQPGPLLVHAYTACAANLRTLALIATSANFNALFPPNASLLTSLEEVTLTFAPQDDCSADAEAASTFFQAIASTLTTLNISFHGTSDEPSRLLQSFLRQGGKATFPKLESFSLFHSEPPASPSSNIVQFLNQHADTLKHLRLQHTRLSPFASQSVDDLDPLFPVLPHLESLNILDGSSSPNGQELTSNQGLDAARAYVQHSGSTLTSLDLMHCSFTLHDLGTLLDILGRGPSEDTEGGRLKSLTVTVQFLSPQLLDMLAEKLPQLDRLKVHFADLRTNDGADVLTSTGEGSRAGSGDLTHEVVEPFLLEMKTRSYSRWTLRSFGIDRTCLRPDTAMAILMPLALCIPHLVEIDGPFVKMWRESGSTWKESDYGLN
ncbi:hypothetical protein PAXINDRAFT_101193 [Paxillus involutus ATCC 200175]|uniref:F-box domain-containing protein n=1 Tax=Paxillus involutus ATCC 200175 TaxID=664439 RepID=A0A0C9TXY1_PAXIN|nr:hypothetical protein PAXINDRAFT_101193 [Paxillus involutus ATCC 200175]